MRRSRLSGLSPTAVPEVARHRMMEWDRAVIRALDHLVASGVELSVKKVILAARFDDGRKVGYSTAYDRTDDGRYVHQASLERIQAAVRLQRGQKKSKKGRDETLAGKDRQIQALRIERQALADDLVSLRAQLADRDEETIRFRREILRERRSVYVLARALTALGVRHLSLATRIRHFEEGVDVPGNSSREIEREIRELLEAT